MHHGTRRAHMILKPIGALLAVIALLVLGAASSSAAPADAAQARATDYAKTIRDGRAAAQALLSSPARRRSPSPS